MAPAFLQCESHPGKSLTAHLTDVAERLASNSPLLRAVGLYHDLAKSTDYFQRYLKGEPVPNLRLKEHAHLGALCLLHNLWPKVEAGVIPLENAVMAFL